MGVAIPAQSPNTIGKSTIYLEGVVRFRFLMQNAYVFTMGFRLVALSAEFFYFGWDPGSQAESKR